MQEIYIHTQISSPTRYQSFFTYAHEINSLMVALLGDMRNRRILEPCAGDGAFITPLLGSAYYIDAIDIDSQHIERLSKIGDRTLRVQNGDFLDHFIQGPLYSSLSIRNDYDAIICNPPYGLKFSLPYRKLIKQNYPDVYARESYGLFMLFGISCLKEHGRYVFIVPDTFLTSRNHRSLRQFLRDKTNITHIALFQSSRFQHVNFGYGNLCIIAGEKSTRGQETNMSWLDCRHSDMPLSGDAFAQSTRISARKINEDAATGWTANIRPISENSKHLGDISECRTGIYTGDNPRFCGYDERNPPSRVNGHPISWNHVRSANTLTRQEMQYGIAAAPFYVPLVRGGHKGPYEPTHAALDWSEEAVAYYRYDKKARLQNSRFYFRRGLAVPMVTSGRLTASYMEGAVFDQGVVGIFPYDETWVEFLLVFLNSTQATEMKKDINPSANNSANYLKRLEIPVPNERQIHEAHKICAHWHQYQTVTKAEVTVDATDYVTREFLPTQIEC